jgi:hypothetical protein
LAVCCGLTQLNNIRARFLGDFPQSELIAESVAMMPPNYSDFSANRRTGSGTYGRATANKIWMSRKFFLLPGIPPLKIENHLQKFHKKITRSAFSICYWLDPALLTYPRPLLANKRHAGRNAGTSGAQ